MFVPTKDPAEFLKVMKESPDFFNDEPKLPQDTMSDYNRKLYEQPSVFDTVQRKPTAKTKVLGFFTGLVTATKPKIINTVNDSEVLSNTWKKKLETKIQKLYEYPELINDLSDYEWLLKEEDKNLNPIEKMFKFLMLNRERHARLVDYKPDTNKIEKVLSPKFLSNV